METSEVRQFVISDGQLPEKPVIIPDFNADHDVLVISGTELKREDLQFVQRGSDAVIIEPKAKKELAILENTNAFDLDPTALLGPFYEALAAGDIEKVLSFLAEDILWETGGPTDILPWAGSWNGISGVKDFFDLLNVKLTYDRLQPTRFIAQGNTVAIVLNGEGKAKNGIGFSGGVVHWVTVRNGKISHLQYYRDSFPIVEAIFGGRPFKFTQLRKDWHDHVVLPVASLRKTDNIIFETGENKPGPTVAAVLNMYGSLQKLDLEEMRNVFTPDVTWHMFGEPDLIPWSGKWDGPEGALESAKAIISSMHFEHFKAIRLISQGDTAAVIIDEPGESKATGLPFHTSVAHIVTANAAGKISQFTNYVDTTGIVEAFLGGRPCVVGAPATIESINP